MKKILLAFAVLASALQLGGCAASVKASSARSVVIKAGGIGKAQVLADSECAKHARFAKFVQGGDFVYHFDCVL